jgi:hypothetical protein
MHMGTGIRKWIPNNHTRYSDPCRLSASLACSRRAFVDAELMYYFQILSRNLESYIS